MWSPGPLVYYKGNKMLHLEGKGVSRNCQGMCRRDFLSVGALTSLGFSLPQYFAAKARGNVVNDRDQRSCILIFNLGAPSQLDTLDMKPDAPREIRGRGQAARLGEDTDAPACVVNCVQVSSRQAADRLRAVSQHSVRRAAKLTHLNSFRCNCKNHQKFRTRHFGAAVEMSWGSQHASGVGFFADSVMIAGNPV